MRIRIYHDIFGSVLYFKVDLNIFNYSYFVVLYGKMNDLMHENLRIFGIGFYLIFSIF